MTNKTENQSKQIPAFYIFAQDADGKSKRVGAAFSHSKGKGFNVLIGNSRYLAFPPKAKSETTGESA